MPQMECSTMCFHAIILKVLISESHKAKTLSAEADSYVMTHINLRYSFLFKASCEKFFGWTQFLNYNDIMPFYNPEVIKNHHHSYNSV